MSESAGSPGRCSSQGFLKVVMHHTVSARDTAVWSPPEWIGKRKEVKTTTGIVFPGNKGDAIGESRTPSTLCLSLSSFYSGRKKKTSYETEGEENDE
jgi:hypothetical protein